MEPVVWLETASQTAALGGKGSALARLLAAGLPVPPGFVVTPSNGVHIGEAETALGAALAAHVRRAYADLARRLHRTDPPVAVRSSATTEDLAQASFAGQYDTFLGVRGAEQVVQYVQRCRDSLVSQRATHYREQLRVSGATLPDAAMAVVVQMLVEADAAGVAFTADPVSADATQVVINAAWGLGQSVVDGLVDADTWRIDRTSRGVVEMHTGDKATRTGQGPDSPRQAVPEHLRRAPCLTATQAMEVASLALRAEQVIGSTADLEWARSGEQIWVLQARPITAAGPATQPGAPAAAPGATAQPGQPGQTGQPGQNGQPPTPAAIPPAEPGPTAQFPFAWPDAETRRRHWRLQGAHPPGGGLPQPLKPLETDLRLQFEKSWWNAGMISGRDRTTVGLDLNGYFYSSQRLLPLSEAEREERKQAFQRPANALHERGQNYFHSVIFPEVDAGNRKLAETDLAALDGPGLASHLDEALRWYVRSWTLHWLWPDNTPTERFKVIYREVTGDESEEGFRSPLAYHPNKFSEAIDGLIRLARIAQEHPALQAAFSAESVPELVDIQACKGGDLFQTELDAFLASQGLRCGAGFGTERNHCLPGWKEDPSVVLALVQKYVSQDLAALEEMRTAAIEERDAAVARIRRKIRDREKRQQFDYWLAAARRNVQAFEDHNYHIDSASNALLHRAIMVGAQRLAAAGQLGLADDIWWLRLPEIAAAFRGLIARDGAPDASVVPAPTDIAGGESAADAPATGESVSDASAPGDPAAERTRGGEAPAADGAAEPVRQPDWRQLVVARQALQQWQKTLTPPQVLGLPEEAPELRRDPPKPDAPAVASVAEADPPGLLVRGRPGSAGTASGRVRLIDPDVLVPKVEAGDVLVAHNAGPLWTPIFPMVAAVVLDEGVLLQHAMLTCREYRVPAVFQTKDGTQRLREGQHVTVDGQRGVVTAVEM